MTYPRSTGTHDTVQGQTKDTLYKTIVIFKSKYHISASQTEDLLKQLLTWCFGEVRNNTQVMEILTTTVLLIMSN